MYNDQQKDIINDNSTKLAVFAVAGSGKSTTLAGKVETVLNQGIMPSKIAVITFTNDASDSILKKVESKGLDTQGLMNKTLHGFCYYLLKTCNDFSGEKTPTILSDSEKSFGFHFWKLASVYKNIPSKNYKDWLSFCYNIKAETLQEPDVLIKKEFGMTPDALKQKIIKEEIRDRNSFAYLMYYEYTAWKKSLNQIDFLDIIVESIYALRKADERCLNFIKSKWNYIFVDECQDTNFLVIEVLKLITKPETNVVFLGDIRQSIYGFNFAKPEYILDYVRRAGFVQKSLNINYRSSEEIVDNANYFIGHYPECNVGGDAISYKGKIGYPVCSIRSTDEIMETDTVVDQITKLVSQDGFTYDDISILYRTHSQSMMLLNWCVNYNIPFQIKSDSKSIFDRPEMKDILAYLKIFNEFSKTKKADFKRIANKPVRYITNSAMDDLDFQDNKVGFGDWFMEKYHRNEKMEILKADIRAYMRRTNEMPLQDQITFVLQEGGVGYQKWWENSENSDKFFDLALYANTLGQLAKSYPTYREFIAQINKIREAIRNSENEGIKFYSIHASKGLEFPVTFILGVCDRMYPFYRAVQEGNRDEEARLFYVASTRPEKRLYYSEILGTLGKIRVNQSPFIDQTYRNVINEDFYSLN